MKVFQFSQSDEHLVTEGLQATLELEHLSGDDTALLTLEDHGYITIQVLDFRMLQALIEALQAVEERML